MDHSSGPIVLPFGPASGNAHLRTIARLLDQPLDAFRKPVEPHLLYESTNGDKWFLRLGSGGVPVVSHLACAPSGGFLTEWSLAAFLTRDVGSPQHEAFLEFIGVALRALISG